MDIKTLLPLLVTIGLALVGYVAAYVNSLRMAQRKDQLERVTQQLHDFYGPLYALALIGELAWATIGRHPTADGRDTADPLRCSPAGAHGRTDWKI